MTKTYRIEGLDCPVCASKVEAGIKKIKGVEDASVSFLAEKLVITADEALLAGIIKEAIKIARKVEPDCEITER